MSFEEALEKLNMDTYPGEGFYTSKRVRKTENTLLHVKCTCMPGLILFVYA